MDWAIAISICALLISLHAEWRATRADRRSAVLWEDNRVKWVVNVEPSGLRGEWMVKVRNEGRDTAFNAKVDPASLVSVAVVSGGTGWMRVRAGERLRFTVTAPQSGLDNLRMQWETSQGQLRDRVVPVDWPKRETSRLPPSA